MRTSKVLLKGEVRLAVFEEACCGDPFIPTAKRKQRDKSKKKVRKARLGWSGYGFRRDARLLPTFVVHKVMGPDGVQFCVRFVPYLAFEDFCLVDEGPVVAEHAFVDREGGC